MAGMDEIRYLSSDELIDFNKTVLKEIKVRKADAPKILSRQKIQDVLDAVRGTSGDVFDKAVVLMTGLVRAHPFASANRRTAYIATKLFLELNGKPMVVAHDPKVLVGIRERFYSDAEVKSWLKGDGIRPFVRG